MSDSIERQARRAEGEMKKIAGRIMARRDRHQRAIDELVAQQAELHKNLELAEAAHEPELLADIMSMLTLVEERLAIETEARDVADVDYQQVLEDAGTLERDLRSQEGAVLRGQAQSITDNDPFLPSPQERALENVRSAISNLEAQVKVNEELSSRPRPAPVDREAMARARLAELKAARGERQTAGGGRTLGPESSRPSVPADGARPTKKKTL